ncbi:hypothetical protein JTE90_021816, partial [Oedothorax gibbosus]
MFGAYSGVAVPHLDHRFFAFHDWGVSVYEPDNCRLYHQIQSTDVIPGTQEYVCGDRGLNCSWGAAINVADRYVYASQPNKDRILIISRLQMVVVDVVVTDKFPVELHYVPNLDQVWVLCWRGHQDRGTKTIQIIRDASQKKKHHTVHPEPVDGHFDLVSGLFVPSPQDLGHGWKYGYVVHTNQRGMYKLDLQGMKYLKTVDLTPYNCAPKSADFASFGGLVILECLEPVTGRHHRPDRPGLPDRHGAGALDRPVRPTPRLARLQAGRHSESRREERRHCGSRDHRRRSPLPVRRQDYAPDRVRGLLPLSHHPLVRPLRDILDQRGHPVRRPPRRQGRDDHWNRPTSRHRRLGEQQKDQSKVPACSGPTWPPLLKMPCLWSTEKTRTVNFEIGS